MSAPSDPPPSKHVVDMLDLESAISDVRGDVLLLELAIDSMGRGAAWKLTSQEPVSGYKLYLLTNEQVTAIHHAMSRALSSADRVAVEFWGHDLAHSA